MSKDQRTFCTNKKARFEYFLMDGYEAGICLKGTEVKSVRAGRANLKESYGRIDKGEVFLYNCHISPYDNGNINNHDPLRPKKLLLRRREIRKLIGKTKEHSLTLIATRLYLSGKWIKVDLHLAKGKRQYDKRQDKANLSAQREIQRAMKDHNQRGR